MRWCLILLMTPDTSTLFSFSACSRMMSMAMNDPVRPTPALQYNKALSLNHSDAAHLQCTTIGPFDGL